MSSTQHTPEPWDLVHWDKRSSAGWRLVSDIIDDHVDLESKDNLERVKVCVNACAGIKNPEAIPDVISDFRFVQEWFTENALDAEHHAIFQVIEQALERLEGKL